YNNDNSIQIYDVREANEFTESHIPMADNFPLSTLTSKLEDYNSNAKSYVHCGSAYRSTIACSILQAVGINGIVNILDTFPNITNRFQG
ncbi:MAG: rhodanese-like domain-containing protein, partial [Bacteroidota bacterium]